MERKTAFWTLALCAGLVGWLVWDIQSMHINYDWHSYLLDPATGRKTRPSELLDLGKIINYTESYINSTTPIERLYDLEFHTNLENPFALEQSYSDGRQLELAGWPVANQSKCASELEWINAQLAEHASYQLLAGQLGHELARLLDSFGRPETGLLTGTVTWLGSHKQCLRASLRGGAIRTRYCQARLRPVWWPKHERVQPRTRIKMGVCLPETCDTLSFDQHKLQLERLLKFELPDFYKTNLEFESLFCLPDERSPIRRLPPSGRLYLIALSAWLAAVLVASLLYELDRRRERTQRKRSTAASCMAGLDLGVGATLPVGDAAAGQKQLAAELPAPSAGRFKRRLLEVLSVHHSLKEFKTDAFRRQRRRFEGGRARVDLGCLDFAKISMAITVVLAHSGYLTSVYTRSIANRIDMNVNDNGRMALSVGRCVDTFFMFFGILTAYTLLKKFSLQQLSSPLTWLAVNAGVLLRITPVFMLVYWYSRAVSPYTGSGPWWDYGVYKYSMKGNCLSEPWWKSIPYFGCAGSPPVATCLLPGWFIVSYSQLSLLMPPLTYLMCKLPNHLSRHLLILFIATISGLQLAIKMYKQTSFKEEAFTLYGAFLADLAEKFESTGTMATLGRVGCVATGCYVGYLLRMYELGAIERWPRWLANKWTLATALALHLALVFLPLIGHRILASSGRLTTMDEFLASYLATMFLWPLLNAIVIINCVTTYNRTAPVRFLGHSFWHTFNKLGLCIFLVHWEILFIGVTSYEQAPSMGFVTDIMKMWSFGVFFSILLAFVIHVLVEAPLTGLLKLLLNNSLDLLAKRGDEVGTTCDTKQPMADHVRAA